MIKKTLWVLFISMLPIVELRAAIPVAAALGLNYYIGFAAAVIGNMIPVPFILLYIPKILQLLSKIKFLTKLIEWIHRKAEKHKDKITNSAFWGLFIFVAIPLPGTGAWTGALVSALFEMPKKRSFVAIFAGVIAAGIIMTLASYGIVSFLSFLAN